MKKIKIFIALILLLTLCGCTSKKYNGELNVLNWSSYIPQEIINDFEEEYNIKVNYNTYASNEELLAKVSNSKEGTYDLIFPSDYMVELMISKNMLEQIDRTRLTNALNINIQFMFQEFDPHNNYSIPFLAATTVITVNRDKIKDEINSYNDLLNSKYKNDIVVLEDQRITIGMALLALGYDMNETNETKLKEAKEWLLKLKNNIKAFDSDSPKSFLITEETDIGIMWNAEALLAKKENPNIEIIYPTEGHAISLDNYCIVKGSKNIDNVYLFIDYLLREDVSKKITEEYPYINTNFKALNMNNEELNTVLQTGTYVKNIGEKITNYDKVWAEIK